MDLSKRHQIQNSLLCLDCDTPVLPIIFPYHRRQSHHLVVDKPLPLLFSSFTMVKEVNAETLKVVLDSWADLKKMDDYEKVAGIMVMKL